MVKSTKMGEVKNDKLRVSPHSLSHVVWVVSLTHPYRGDGSSSFESLVTFQFKIIHCLSI